MAEETRSFTHTCIMPARRMGHNSVQTSVAFTAGTGWERIGSESLTPTESRFVHDQMWWVRVDLPTNGVVSAEHRVISAPPRVVSVDECLTSTPKASAAGGLVIRKTRRLRTRILRHGLRDSADVADSQVKAARIRRTSFSVKGFSITGMLPSPAWRSIAPGPSTASPVMMTTRSARRGLSAMA